MSVQRELFSEPPVLSVSELTAVVKELLERALPMVWVSGEISNFSRPSSGHCYLTLKDDRAQLRAVIWRMTAARLRFDLEDGLEVVCRGHLDVYAPRGTYQLVIEEIEPKGVGALELAFRQLRDRLAKEGLFDPARKRPLPAFARRIAVVTSPTGAAIRDFLQVLARRWRGAEVLIVPVRVQGQGAAQEIAAAIDQVQQLAEPVDCIVVTRGGGSMEDLWAFNEETVVRAIHRSRIPVVSGVGHEIDVTLADLAADVRALTPSEAAERVAPSADELRQRLGQLRQRLVASAGGIVSAARRRLDALAQHRVFRRPEELLSGRGRQLDELEARIARAWGIRLNTASQRLAALAARLDALSPLAVLGRGYTLTRRLADGRLVRSAAELREGDDLETRFHDGVARSRVTAGTEGDASGP